MKNIFCLVLRDAYDATLIINVFDDHDEVPVNLMRRSLEVTKSGGSLVVTTGFPGEPYLAKLEMIASQLDIRLTRLDAPETMGHPLGMHPVVYRVDKSMSSQSHSRSGAILRIAA